MVAGFALVNSFWKLVGTDSVPLWVYLCPKTKRLVDTGIIADRLIYQTHGDARMVVQCEACGGSHDARVHDMLFCDPPPPVRNGG